MPTQSRKNTSSCFVLPAQLSAFDNLVVAQSTRHGGVSPAPFSSLNLGGSTQDDPNNVRQNHALFWASLGVNAAKVAKSHQVHGDEVLVVDHPGRYEGYDALITDQPGIVLAVTIADCTPILIYDPVGKAIGAVHAGWRGTVARIVSKTIQKMQEQYGTRPADCYAFIGACIDECSFEVGGDVADSFSDTFKRLDPETGKYFVDLKKANKSQLSAAGVPDDQIEVSALSTVLDNATFFSYRLEKGMTGRMLAVIGMKE